MRAGNDPDATSAEVLEVVRSTVELATTHGLTEQACMAQCMVATTQFELGGWDDALEVGFEAIAVAERNAYFRPSYRTWVAVVPILEARRDRDGLARLARWFDTIRSAFPEPPSAYGQVHNAAMDRMLASVGLPPVWGRPITVETLALEGYNNPDYIAAQEITVREWIPEGEMQRAAEAVERIEQTARAGRDAADSVMEASSR